MAKKENISITAKPVAQPSRTKTDKSSVKKAPTYPEDSLAPATKGVWISINEKLPRICEDILFTDGKRAYAGWLESAEDDDNPIFYDVMELSWPDNITHWAEFPLPPK